MKYLDLFVLVLSITLFSAGNYKAQLSIPLNVPKEIKNNLEKVNVKYINFNNEIKESYLIVDKKLSKEVKQIFDSLLVHKFPINKISPMESYGWNDNKSMSDNNTSAFNYRFNNNSKNKLSQHAFGRAIDINPYNNPLFYKGVTKPKGAVYDISKPGTITKNSYIVKIFKKFGWRWGGDFTKVKDFQHFEK
jgi:hypothetical protein